MTNRVEKLCLLSELIAFAKVDCNTKPDGFKFLHSIAKQLEITDEDFTFLLKHTVNNVSLNSHSERIVQFHRLVLLMNLGDTIDERQITKIFNFGLQLGLRHDTIERVLDVMQSFPNKIVPPDLLIDILKVQYN